MAKTTVNTSELAALLRMDPRSVARWARSLGVEPLRRQRIGESTVTVWSLADLAAAVGTLDGARESA